ncbi:DUF4097 family beta strand repeat-containing protein [Streptomyces gilvus]|uniref:DUF4097 family beta strand repeat-containing protein n=1 Tax=Streptomyces gilvus TaxID=2920937 RepID=UPI0027E4B537|nr:DUF4097 family beta strand repeat-containing protein [Streptomyces sp. CME 23]
MPSRPALLLTAVLSLLAATAACGDGGREASRTSAAETSPRPASGDHLVITTDNGLRLRPADGHRVTVDDHVHTAWSHHDRTLTLDLSCAGPCPRMPYVKIPDGMSVTAGARNAGIDAVGIAAALDLSTVNGDVTVTRAGDDTATLRLTTRNGSVRASGLAAGRLHASTVNGDVTLACTTAPSGISATTANGSVDVTLPHDAPAYGVTAGTRNGRTSVDVPTHDARTGPTMKLTTVNGDVDAHQE